MDSLKREIDSFLLDKLRGRPPSAAYTVVWRDGSSIHGSIGYRDVENGVPATPETLYGVGSITKTFTSLTILMLEEEGEEGLLSIDDPVSQHLPIDLSIDGEEIRIWHLLSHSSGIPALAYAESLIRGLAGEAVSYIPIARPEDILSFMDRWREWALARPGDRYFYLNEGYLLAEMIIERVSGMGYGEALRRYVLERLGMGMTSIGTPVKPDLIATPYVVGRDGVRRGSAGEGIPRRVVERLETPRIRTSLLNREEYYCLGLTRTRIGGLELYGHSGSVLVYTAYMAYTRDEGVGVAIMSNGTGYPMSYAGLYILARALDKDPNEFQPLLYDETLESLRGTYESYRGGFRVDVERMGGILVIRYGGKNYEASGER